jgi:hypothetical protein
MPILLQAHLQFYFKGIKCLAAKELAKQTKKKFLKMPHAQKI